METFTNFKDNSELTAQELSKLDRKVEVGIGLEKPRQSWGGIFKPILNVSVFTVVVVGIFILSQILFGGNNFLGVQKVSAEKILTEAITIINQLKQGKTLLKYHYVETDNSAVITSHDYDTQDVVLTLDLVEPRFLINRQATRTAGSIVTKLSDNTPYTQTFPRATINSLGTDNTVFSYQFSEGSENDGQFKTWLYENTFPGEVFDYKIQDPISAQEEMLKYVLNFIKPTEYAEQKIVTGGKEVDTYRIDFEYQYKGFVDNSTLRDFNYETSIYFDKENHLPVKVVDTKLDPVLPEVFQTEYLAFEYTDASKAERDQMFKWDLSQYYVVPGDGFRYTVAGNVTLNGNITSENKGEIFNQPVLNYGSGTDAGKKAWLEGVLFYDPEIVRPSTLTRFLNGKNVEVKGLLLKSNDTEVVLVDTYKLTGTY